MQYLPARLLHPPVWVWQYSATIAGLVMVIGANTTPALARNIPARLVLSVIGGLLLPGTALCLTTSAELSKDFGEMNMEAARDVHNKLLQQYVSQFDPIEVLEPQPTLALPTGGDEATQYATAIMQALATFNEKAPIVLNYKESKTGYSSIRLSFAPANLKQGLEAVKRADLIHAACGLPKHQEPITYFDSGNLVVEVPRRDRQFIQFNLKPEKRTDEPRLLIGYDALTGEPVEHILTPKGESPSLLFCGGSGSGKTVAAIELILSGIYRYSPAQLQFAIVDCKGGSYQWLKGSPWLWGEICEDPNTGKRYLDRAIEEGLRRQRELFPTVGATDIVGYNKKSPNPIPVIVFFVDELAEWMAGLKGDPKSEAKPEEVQANLARIAQLFRSAGIVLAVGTQKPVVEDKQGKFPVVGTLLKGNLLFRLAFKVNTPKESEIALGDVTTPNASSLLGKGDGLWSKPDGTLTRIQTAYVPDDDSTELERLHAIAANFHCPGWEKTPVSVPNAEEVVGDYLQTLERSFGLPAVKPTPKPIPASGNLDKKLWQAITALKMFPTQPSKTKIIELVWGVSKGGSHFDRDNPNSKLSQYERLLEDNREAFIVQLIKLGATPNDIARAAFDAKGDRAQEIEEIRKIAERNYFGWPYYQPVVRYPDDYQARYSQNWSSTTKLVKAATNHRCIFCGEQAAESHHAYYRSWWGKVADAETQAIGVALFPLCDRHHKPQNHMENRDCAHHPENWIQDGIWDAHNTLEFYAKLLQEWLK